VSSYDQDAFSWGPDSDGWEDNPESGSLEGELSGEPQSGLNWTVAVLAVLYVLWALAWVVGLNQTPALVTGSTLDNSLYRLGEFLAYISAPLWFVGVVWLGLSWTAKKRTGVLLLGLIILLPWPYILPVVLT
jgi:hypothetical protein